ncbi:MAG: hypothetical protein ACO263_02880 [Cyclobacteriaceae bacterium]|jgi:hypothetical protein
MNTRSFITGGLVAGIFYFFLGWLVFGILLADTMRERMNEGLFRKDEDIILWALVVGNVAYGFLLSYIFHNMGVENARRGSAVGAVIGLVTSLTFDLNFFGTSTMYNDLVVITFDITAFVVVSAITGSVLGLWMSRQAVKS